MANTNQLNKQKKWSKRKENINPMRSAVSQREFAEIADVPAVSSPVEQQQQNNSNNNKKLREPHVPNSAWLYFPPSDPTPARTAYCFGLDSPPACI